MVQLDTLTEPSEVEGYGARSPGTGAIERVGEQERVTDQGQAASPDTISWRTQSSAWSVDTAIALLV